jgi:hypothetical protein
LVVKQPGPHCNRLQRRPQAVGSAPPRLPPGEQSGGSGLNSSRLKGRSRLALPKTTSFSALSKRVYSEAARVGMGPRSTRGRAIKGRDWIMPSWTCTICRQIVELHDDGKPRWPIKAYDTCKLQRHYVDRTCIAYGQPDVARELASMAKAAARQAAPY